jgi:DNA-binding MarR family transcriptional regulator
MRAFSSSCRCRPRQGFSLITPSRYVDMNYNHPKKLYHKFIWQESEACLTRQRFCCAILVSAFMCSVLRERLRGISTTHWAPVGLTNGQFSLMMSLNRPEPPSIGAVASLLAMDRTTLTAALKPLQRRGLIKITTDTRDHRARLPDLTPKGKKLLARGVPVSRSTHTAVEARLAPPDGLRKNLRTLS